MANTKNKLKTNCPYGHPLVEGNLILSQLKLGKRSCKTCFNERNKLKRNPNGNQSPALMNKQKTHCKYGHEFTEENTRIDKNGKRICRACKRLTAKDIYHNKPGQKEYHKDQNAIFKEKNPNYFKDKGKEFRDENPNYSNDWNKNNPSKRKEIHKRNEAKPERKAYKKQWNRLNPRSGTDRPYDVQESMMNTRIRNNNTCQWYRCGRTPKTMSIAVHHIFPIEEYPELAAVEEYQICYCAEHHYLWHKARGDSCQHVLKGAIKRVTYD